LASGVDGYGSSKAGNGRPDGGYRRERGDTMQIRTSEATWDGTLNDGKGRFWTESGEVSGVFSFQTRFEDQDGTNPEELIGAALASCFSMALAATSSAQGTYRTSSAPSRR
jgi:organic hydroperoxide reductase OsmC/OhrA